MYERYLQDVNILGYCAPNILCVIMIFNKRGWLAAPLGNNPRGAGLSGVFGESRSGFWLFSPPPAGKRDVSLIVYIDVFSRHLRLSLKLSSRVAEKQGVYAK